MTSLLRSSNPLILKYGLIIFSLFLLSLFLLLFTLLCLYEQSTTSTSKIYQYIESSHTTNQVKYGFVSLEQELPAEEFISYPSTNSLVLISNFGSHEYECTGACRCSEPSKRRLSTGILTRSLTLIFTAFTSSVALSIAKETFDSHCETRFKDVCSQSQIRSDVYKCSEKIPGRGEYHYPYPEEELFEEEIEEEPDVVNVEDLRREEEERKKKEEEERRRKEEEEEEEQFNVYMCMGHCLKNWFFVPKIEATGQFPELMEKYGDCTRFRKTDRVDAKSMEEAKENYIAQHLDPYCKNLSYLKLKLLDDTDLEDPWQVYMNRKKGKATKEKLVYWEIAVCVGGYGKYARKEFMEVTKEEKAPNEHVNCIPGGFLKIDLDEDVAAELKKRRQREKREKRMKRKKM